MFISKGKLLLNSYNNTGVYTTSIPRLNWLFDVLQPNAQQAMLSAEEERILLRFYEFQMRDLCKRFQPPMPKAVIGTAFNYFKRFYLNNSVMNYHPKEIL